MKKLLLLTLALGFTTFSFVTPALALTDANNCTNQTHQNSDPTKPTVPDVQRQCDPALANSNKYCSDPNVSASNCTLISDFIQPAVDFLSVLFGVAVVAAIIYGGIEYAGSGGDPSKAAAGKNRIRNAIVALVAYIFLLAGLNFIVPGGIV